jgi:hydrogenase nickel incorporation protein HypB
VKNEAKTARGTFQVHDMSLSLLKANDYVASTIKKEMHRQDTLLINLTSSAGSGKTALLEVTADRLKDRLNMAVLGGDLETERDSERLRKHGITALQIVTGGICHLEAQMVSQAMEQLDLAEIDLLFVENVGNLVCPAAYDLGEDLRITLIASTEGDDKPQKYPRMFLTSDMMVISKIDLLPYLPFSVEAVSQDALEVNPDLEIMTLSSLSGEGIDAWCDYLLAQVQAKRAATAAARATATP